MDAAALPAVLLPYQQRWIADPSPFKVAEKGRRTGLTWAEASDDVLIAAADKAAGGQNVYYIGQDKDMTEEYIDACAMWAREFNQAAAAVESGLWDDADDEGNSKSILTYTIRFPKSRHRITALASRPKKLRGRQGVLVGDEAAFQDDLDGLIKAADSAYDFALDMDDLNKRQGEKQYLEEGSSGNQGFWMYASLRR